MKRNVILFMMLCLVCGAVSAQNSTKASKKNLVVKEWNTTVGTATPQLDHVTTYDSLGRKVEEIEYASGRQKKRVVYEYNGSGRKVSREIVYDEKNNPSRIKKIEYDANGNKTRQMTYRPNGKLKSTKTYEYSYKKTK